MTKLHFYRGVCLTNLHVGANDSSYGVIDNTVSRDIVLGVPNIPGSGVKGAIREYFEYGKGKDTSILADDRFEKIFGSKRNKDTGNNNTQGAYKFFDAICTRFPQFDVDAKSGIVKITQQSVETYLNNLKKALGNEADNLDLSKLLKGKKIEEFPDMPVVARNILDENGQSQNLWYEEYVPHTSEFLFIVESDEESDELGLSGKVIQFGANASVGMGQIKLEVIS
ncbi:RAMP superfamily CRISPR-associated protein [Lactovum odontotermitis]